MKRLVHGAIFAHIFIASIVISAIALGFSTFRNHIGLHSDVYCTLDGTLSTTKLIQSHRSYCIKSDASSKVFVANTPAGYSFSIVDDEANTTKDFAIIHTKQMHIIIARKDLAYFQHLHPTYDASTGVFTLSDLTFPADGKYRIFADFAVDRGVKDAEGMPFPITISEDVEVGSNYPSLSLGDETRTKTFDGLKVSLATHGALKSGEENMLMFSIAQDSKPVTDLQQYLGALGHSVILRENTLDFIHAHPMVTTTQNGTVSFMVNFPLEGMYKVFTQFQKNDKVLITDFVVNVAHGGNASMPKIDHTMH